MCGRVYIVVIFDIILDNRGQQVNVRDFYFFEFLSDYSIMFLVNGSVNGCKNIMVYFEGLLGNVGM